MFNIICSRSKTTRLEGGANMMFIPMRSNRKRAPARFFISKTEKTLAKIEHMFYIVNRKQSSENMTGKFWRV